MDKTESIESWNKKRILITVLIAVLLGFGGYGVKSYVLDKAVSVPNFLKSVLGVDRSQKEVKTKGLNTNTKSIPLPLQAIIGEKLDNLKKEVNNLNVVDIASSSPQVQKIINDLNALKQVPLDEAKEICQKVCSGL